MARDELVGSLLWCQPHHIFLLLSRQDGRSERKKKNTRVNAAHYELDRRMARGPDRSSAFAAQDAQTILCGWILVNSNHQLYRARGDCSERAVAGESIPRRRNLNKLMHSESAPSCYFVCFVYFVDRSYAA